MTTPGDSATPAEPTAPPWSFEEVVATVAMMALVVITTANVVARYWTNAAFAWTEEISAYGMVVMVFAGAAAAAVRNTHIRMDLFAQRGSASWQRRAAAIGRVSLAITFAAFAVLLARTAVDEWRYGDLNALDWPRWWVTVPDALLCALVAWRALAGLRGDGAQS